jgi:hypothetical protein
MFEAVESVVTVLAAMAENPVARRTVKRSAILVLGSFLRLGDAMVRSRA